MRLGLDRCQSIKLVENCFETVESALDNRGPLLLLPPFLTSKSQTKRHTIETIIPCFP